MGKKSKAVDDHDKRFGVSKITLGEARQQLRIPPDTQFRGYCVHIPASDEFLGGLKSTAFVTGRAFCKGPAMAMRFPSFKAAEKHCERVKGEIVVGLFESDTQFFVAIAEQQ